MRASFNGEIAEIPGIAVDNFQNTQKRAYFLSHCHADHISGLKDLFYHLSETVFIYMSEPSAAIVETHIDEKLKSFIKPLTLGSTTITIPADEKNEIPEMYVGVSLIPAGHCFGSVMFLFETPLKTVMYTGDFRITQNSVSKMAQLHKNNKPIKLDVLYVDTTFQGVQYETFPKRSEIIDGVVRKIQSWLERGDQYKVGLVTSARYGYEVVFNEIYKKMGMKVYVDGNWTLYSKFLHLLPGVTNEESETKIHLCARNRRYCNCCPDRPNKYCLYINFSAMRWDNFNPEDLSIVNTDENYVNVCFSTHCSRSELIYFVEYMSPKKVVGFSEPYNTERNVLHTPVKNSPTPSKTSVEKAKRSGEEVERPKKVPKHLLSQMFG